MKKRVKRKEKQSLIVLRHANKIYYPKLTIRSCLSINKIFGEITQPLLTVISVETQILILSLSLDHYSLSDDELYEIADKVEDLNSLILELYQEAGIINQNPSKLPTESEYEPINDIRDDSVTFENHVMELLAQCMSIGMKEDEFYELTLNQITRYVESHTKQQENKYRDQAFFDYQLASLIKIAIGSVIDRKVTFPSFEKAYPFVKGIREKEIDNEWEMEVQRIKLREWAEQMNKKIEKKKKESC